MFTRLADLAGRVLMPLGSILFLVARPRLWWMVIAPGLINLAIVVAFGVYAMGADPPALIEALAADQSAWWADYVAMAGTAAFRIMLFGAGLLVAYLLATTIASPFCDLLGEEIEQELLAGFPELQAPRLTISAALRHAAREAVQRLFLLLLLLFVGAVFGLVPLLGWALGPLAGYTTLYLLVNLDALSYPMDRRRLGLRLKVTFLRDNLKFWGPTGVGMTMLALPICCPPLFLPPLSAVTATRLYCRKILDDAAAKEALPVGGATP